MTAPALELRLLGPPTVRLDGTALSLPTRKSLALVAYLALEGAQTRAHLADVLWGELDDEGARKNLRKELFRLRDTALRSHLETEDDRIALVEFHSDVSRFLNLMESQPDAAPEVYGGPLLAGLEVSSAERFQDWLNDARERFENLYRRGLEAQARRLEAGGDLRGALDAFERLVTLDELQEVHHREVMRLRWRLGDRAGALERFSRLGRVLMAELGLEPLPETMALARRIEAAQAPDEPEPARAHARTAMPNLERPPLVGRDDTWAWLDAQDRGLALLTSDAGVGKTRLATDYARARGSHVILRGFESATGTPFYPVAAGLRAALEAGQLDPDALDPVWRLEAARLVPELHDARQSGMERPADGVPRPEGRARFLEGLSRALLACLGPNATLVLDDLHWFDASSLELIAHLVRQLGGTMGSTAPGLHLIGTARRLELQDAAAHASLSALEREGLLTRFELTPLSKAQVLSLVQSLSGDRATLFSTRLFDATGGNPLFVLETLRNLFQNALLTVEDGHWVTPFDEATEDYTELPIPEGVREIVLGRLDRLGGATRRWLEAASLAAEPFPADALDGATALSEWEDVEALERALEAQVLQQSGSAYRFAHNLVRRSLSAGLSAERRRLIHRRLAGNLIESRGASALIADHLERAERFSDAIPHRVQAAEAAHAVYAHTEAKFNYARALELGPDERTAFAIHRAAASLAVSLLDLDGLLHHATAMLGLAETVQDAQLEAQARLTIARHSIYRGQFAAALEQVRSKRTVPDASRAEAGLIEGTALVALGRLEEAEQCVRYGLGNTVRNDFDTTANLHEILKVIHQQRGQYEDALEQARAATDAYRAARNRESELNMRAQTGQLHGALGQTDTTLELISKVVEDAREHGLEKVLTFALAVQADECLRALETETAERAIEEGLRLTAGKYPAREAQFTSLGGRLRHRKGAYEDALEWSERAFEMTERLGLTVQRTLQHLYSADLALELGWLTRAWSLLEVASSLVAESGQSALRLPCETLCARIELERGRPEAALARLEGCRDAMNTASFEHRALFSCTLAKARLSAKQPDLALDVLQSLRVPAWLEPRQLSLRLEAQAALEPQARDTDTDLDAARRWTERPNLSGLDLIGLHRAIALTFTARKQPARARAHTAEAERLLQALRLEVPPPEPGTHRERPRV